MKYAAIVVILILSGSAQSEATEGGSTSMASGEWVAIRFNLTEGSDLFLMADWVSCPHGDEPHFASAYRWYIIDDGRALVSQTALLDLLWAPGTDTVRVGVDGEEVILPPVSVDGGCLSAVGTAWARPDSTGSLTLLVLGEGSRMTFSWSATWSRGVESWDLLRGPAVVRMKSQFDQGVSAAYYPLPVGVGASALLEQRVRSQGDMLGWWAPHVGGLGVSLNECRLDDRPCPPADAYGIHNIFSEDPAELAVRVDAEARVGLPYYALGIAVLPDELVQSHG